MTRLYTVNGLMTRLVDGMTEIGSYCYRVTAETADAAMNTALQASFSTDPAAEGWRVDTIHVEDITDFALAFARAALREVN